MICLMFCLFISTGVNLAPKLFVWLNQILPRLLGLVKHLVQLLIQFLVFTTFLSHITFSYPRSVLCRQVGIHVCTYSILLENGTG